MKKNPEKKRALPKSFHDYWPFSLFILGVGYRSDFVQPVGLYWGKGKSVALQVVQDGSRDWKLVVP